MLLSKVNSNKEILGECLYYKNYPHKYLEIMSEAEL